MSHVDGEESLAEWCIFPDPHEASELLPGPPLAAAPWGGTHAAQHSGIIRSIYHNIQLPYSSKVAYSVTRQGSLAATHQPDGSLGQNSTCRTTLLW